MLFTVGVAGETGKNSRAAARYCCCCFRVLINQGGSFWSNCLELVVLDKSIRVSVLEWGMLRRGRKSTSKVSQWTIINSLQVLHAVHFDLAPIVFFLSLIHTLRVWHA